MFMEGSTFISCIESHESKTMLLGNLCQLGEGVEDAEIEQGRIEVYLGEASDTTGKPTATSNKSGEKGCGSSTSGLKHND